MRYNQTLTIVHPLPTYKAREMERFLIRAIFLAVVVLLLNAAGLRISLGAERQTIKCVVEWEQSPVSDTQMPPMTVAQLRAEFEKAAAAGAALKSWEARCRVTSWSGDLAAKTHSTLLVSNGKEWIDERRLGDWQDAKIEYRKLCDGQCVRHIFSTSDPKIIIESRSEFAASEHATGNVPDLPIGFPPYLLIRNKGYYPISGFAARRLA